MSDNEASSTLVSSCISHVSDSVSTAGAWSNSAPSGYLGGDEAAYLSAGEESTESIGAQRAFDAAVIGDQGVNEVLVVAQRVNEANRVNEVLVVAQRVNEANQVVHQQIEEEEVGDSDDIQQNLTEDQDDGRELEEADESDAESTNNNDNGVQEMGKNIKRKRVSADGPSRRPRVQ